VGEVEVAAGVVDEAGAAAKAAPGVGPENVGGEAGNVADAGELDAFGKGCGDEVVAVAAVGLAVAMNAADVSAPRPPSMRSAPPLPTIQSAPSPPRR